LTAEYATAPATMVKTVAGYCFFCLIRVYAATRAHEISGMSPTHTSNARKTISFLPGGGDYAVKFASACEFARYKHAAAPATKAETVAAFTAPTVPVIRCSIFPLSIFSRRVCESRPTPVRNSGYFVPEWRGVYLCRVFQVLKLGAISAQFAARIYQVCIVIFAFGAGFCTKIIQLSNIFQLLRRRPCLRILYRISESRESRFCSFL